MTGQQMQDFLHADRGYLLAGIWLVIVVIAICAPAALAAIATSKRGRR